MNLTAINPMTDKEEIKDGVVETFHKRGLIIAPNGFTKSAEKLAESNNIDLIHHSEIKDL